MTAAELRELKVGSASSATNLLLREIAAQLADLNEHFRMVDEAVFGAPQAKKAGVQ
jgi:hypothetical protein